MHVAQLTVHQVSVIPEDKDFYQHFMVIHVLVSRYCMYIVLVLGGVIVHSRMRFYQTSK